MGSGKGNGTTTTRRRRDVGWGRSERGRESPGWMWMMYGCGWMDGWLGKWSVDV